MTIPRWGDQATAFVGMAVALLISGSLVGYELLRGLELQANPLDVVPIVAVPISVLLGAQYANRVARVPKLDLRAVTLFAVEGLVLGDIVASVVVLAMAGQVHGAYEFFAAAVLTSLLGTIFAIPYFVVSWPVALLWAIVVRLLTKPVRDAAAAGAG